MVQEALDKVMAGRTALIIAHRLTTVEKCNRLAVIADGIVAEEGSYDQLLNKEGGSFNLIAKGLNEEKK
jgi:ABC-type multidrug transport system fused ATPase/permease subunit